MFCIRHCCPPLEIFKGAFTRTLYTWSQSLQQCKKTDIRWSSKNTFVGCRHDYYVPLIRWACKKQHFDSEMIIAKFNSWEEQKRHMWRNKSYRRPLQDKNVHCGTKGKRGRRIVPCRSLISPAPELHHCKSSDQIYLSGVYFHYAERQSKLYLCSGFHLSRVHAGNFASRRRFRACWRKGRLALWDDDSEKWVFVPTPVKIGKCQTLYTAWQSRVDFTN